jgi:hypothetical protein
MPEIVAPLADLWIRAIEFARLSDRGVVLAYA